MRHAGPVALTALAPLLGELRKRTALVEKRPGIFYLKGKSFLHFHEDAAGLFADLKRDGLTFRRYRVVTRDERKALLSDVDRTQISSETSIKFRSGSRT